MGLGAFAGAQLVIPKLPAVFDMGRAAALPLAPTSWQYIDPMTVYPSWIGVDPAAGVSGYSVLATLQQYGQFVKVTHLTREELLDELREQQRLFQIQIAGFRAQQVELDWAKAEAYHRDRAELRRLGLSVSLVRSPFG